jgi:hypothetical protein
MEEEGGGGIIKQLRHQREGWGSGKVRLRGGPHGTLPLHNLDKGKC